MHEGHSHGYLRETGARGAVQGTFLRPTPHGPGFHIARGILFRKSEEFARSCACFLRRVRTSHRHRRHRPIAKSERMSNARFCARYMMESYAYVPCGVRANLCLRAPRIWVGLHVLWKPPHVLCSSRCNVSEWMLSIGAQTLFHAGSATPFACGSGGGDTHSPQAVRQCRSPFHVRAGEFPNIRDCRARNMIYSVECQHLRRLTRIARWRIIFILYCSIERHSRGGHSRLRFVAPCSSSQ